MYACMHVCMYVFMYVCMCIYTYINIHTYTYVYNYYCHVCIYTIIMFLSLAAACYEPALTSRVKRNGDARCDVLRARIDIECGKHVS